MVDGAIPAGRLHRLGCERHLRNRAAERSGRSPFRLDEDQIARFVAFARCLKHFEGEFAGRPIELDDWQLFALGSLVGWVHRETGLRRFRTGYIEIPRKNGKSTLAAVVTLYFGFFDREPGAQTFCAATKRDQARIVFDAAKRMAKASGLGNRITIQRFRLWDERTAARVEPLCSEYDSLDGLNPHVIVLDEAHALTDRGLIDVLETAMGARRQPLMLWITTAGSDPLGPCGDQHRYAESILTDALTDDTTFAFITHADVDDDPFDARVWRKANPGYGVSVKPDNLRELADKAKAMPRALAAFRTKRLNEWVTASTPWLNLDGWKRGQTQWSPEFREALERRPSFGGLDLSSKTDLAAYVRVVPPFEDDPTWYLLPTFWTPAEGIEERERQAQAPYRQWTADGHLDTCMGSRIDHRDIFNAIIAHPCESLGYDPWNIGNLATDIADEWDETRVIEIPQNYAQLSEPSKEFEALVAAGLVDSGGHPVMTWMVGNAVVTTDPNGNIRPTKDPKKTRGRIDGVVSAIMGLKLAKLDEVQGGSIYDAYADGSEEGIAVL